MRTKQFIGAQLANYKKEYERTKDFNEFRTNINQVLSAIEEMTPVTPFFSSTLFQLKLDCENMDRIHTSQLIHSLKTFVEKLPE